MQDIEFQVDRQTIRGKLFYPEKLKEKNPAVLLIHGWESSQKRMFSVAEELIKIGYMCLTFDLRGHGVSDGVFASVSREDHIKDAASAYDFLKQQDGIDDISLVGSSYGSYIGVLLTQKRKINNLVLRVPALYLQEGFALPVAGTIEQREYMYTLRSQSLSYKENSALLAVHEFRGKVLIVESEKDEQIPHQTIQNYIDAADKQNLTHIVMKDTFHSLGTDEKRQEFAKIVRGWLEKLKDISFVLRTPGKLAA